MKIQSDNESKPNDISTLVKRRLEKRAAGVTFQPDFLLNKSQPSKESETLKGHLHEKPLVDEFNSLMMGFRSDPEPVKQQSKDDQNNSPHHTYPRNDQKQSEIDGTSKFFSTLNKQEVSKIERGLSERKVEFMVDLHDLGKVKVIGQFDGVSLQVQLNLPDVLPKSKYESLAEILTTQLAKAVGVPVEIQID